MNITLNPENAYKTSVSIDYSRAVMEAGGIPHCFAGSR